jgi:hypothetical protein
MAQLASTAITGAILVGCTADCSKVGNLSYNTGTCKLRYSYASLGAFVASTGPNMPSRYESGCPGSNQVTGTQNAALLAGACPSPSGPAKDLTITYNGSTWASGGNLITGREWGRAAGTQNAGLYFGGRNPVCLACTEEYNGTSWASSGALINCSVYATGAGTLQNAAIAFRGGIPVNVSRTIENYNGSTWSASGGAYYNDGDPSVTGAQNSAAASGGFANCCATAIWDGITWSGGGKTICGGYQFTLTGTSAYNVFKLGRSNCGEVYSGLTWSSAGPTTFSPHGNQGAAGSAGLVLSVGGSPATCCIVELTAPTSIVAKDI